MVLMLVDHLVLGGLIILFVQLPAVAVGGSYVTAQKAQIVLVTVEEKLIQMVVREERQLVDLVVEDPVHFLLLVVEEVDILAEVLDGVTLLHTITVVVAVLLIEEQIKPILELLLLLRVMAV